MEEVGAEAGEIAEPDSGAHASALRQGCLGSSYLYS